MTTNNLLDRLNDSIIWKVTVIGIIILLLLIPMSMVESVINERSYVYRSVTQEITNSWGGEVKVVEPILTISKSKKIHQHNAGFIFSKHNQHLLPENLSISGKMNTQIRKRGIYKVPVFSGNLNLKGDYLLTKEVLDNFSYEKKPLLQMPFDLRAIKKTPILKWNGKTVNVSVVKSSANSNWVIFNAEIPKDSILKTGKNSFELSLDLSGSNALIFQSGAKQSEINVVSNWDSPSFFGGTLPFSHEINDTGFKATWKNNNFFTDIGHENSREISPAWVNNDNEYGVRFIETVDTYQLVTRVTKYALLFLTLLFSVYFIYETIGGSKLHPIQYVFVGFANCIFYLLLLSLSEHVSFNIAYTFSAAASSLLIAMYSRSILRSTIKGITVFVKLSVLYMFIFLILKSEDYALLIGSLGLFIILALIMYLTRNFDWQNRTIYKQAN